MLLYLIYRVAQIIVMVFPLKFSYWFWSRVAVLNYYLSKKDRNIILNNIKNISDKDDKKARRVARAVFRNFAKYLVDFLRFRKMGKPYIEKYVKLEGVENLEHALEKKKGVIAFSAHLGNWEWGAAILAQLGYPIHVIALAHKHKGVNNFFLNQRAIKGVKNIPVGGSVRKSLEALANNEIIGILSDRDFSNNSVPVNFFGKTAFMPIGTALFAIKGGCTLLPVFTVREYGNVYKYVFEKPLEYTLSGDKKSDIRNIMQKVSEIIEKYIRLYPEQWFIFCNPWKKI